MRNLFYLLGIFAVVAFAILAHKRLRKTSPSSWSQDLDDSAHNKSDRNFERTTKSFRKEKSLQKESQIIGNPVLANGSPEEIISFFRRHNLTDPKLNSLALSITESRFPDFSIKELLDLNEVVANGLILSSLGKELSERIKTTDDYAHFLNEFMARENPDLKVNGLLTRVAEELSKSNQLRADTQTFGKVLDSIASISSDAGSRMVLILERQIRDQDPADRATFLGSLIDSSENPESLNLLRGLYVDALLGTGVPFQALGEHLLTLDPPTAVSATSKLITDAYTKGEEDWAFEFANQSIEKHTTDELSTEVVRTLTNLLLKNERDPSKAAKWSLTIPEDTPGKEVAIMRSFSALFRHNPTQAEEFVKKISNPTFRSDVEDLIEAWKKDQQ